MIFRLPNWNKIFDNQSTLQVFKKLRSLWTLNFYNFVRQIYYSNFKHVIRSEKNILKFQKFSVLIFSHHSCLNSTQPRVWKQKKMSLFKIDEYGKLIEIILTKWKIFRRMTLFSEIAINIKIFKSFKRNCFFFSNKKIFSKFISLLKFWYKSIYTLSTLFTLFLIPPFFWYFYFLLKFLKINFYIPLSLYLFLLLLLNYIYFFLIF